MRKRIAFLINPSKRVRLSEYVHWVKTRVSYTVMIFDEVWPTDVRDFDEIWVMGGDGTFNYFVNHYPACDLPIALFKGGTGNDFYRKLFGDPSREMHLVSVLESHVLLVDAGQVNQMLFLNGVGIGIEGEVVTAMDAIHWIGGGLGYYLAAIPALFKFKPYHACGQPVFLCMVFNSSHAGGGFHFFPMASIQDGMLDMLICDPLPIWKRFIYLPIIQAGKHTRLPFVHFSSISSKRIECDRVLKAQVDGEVLEAQTFDFKILPSKFKFIVPIQR